MWKMLVVDDDKFERDGVKFLVDKYGLQLELIEADSGEEALVYLEEHEIDILFTDIRMNGMDGLELAEQVRAMGRPIKVVFMSAYGEFEYAQRAIDLNAIRYILKPVEVSEFLKVISQVILLCEEERQDRNRRDKLEAAYSRDIRYEKQKRVTELIHGKIGEDAAACYPAPQVTAIPFVGGDKAVHMIMLDTRSRFFDLHDLELERGLKDLIAVPFELVHLNEFQSLLLVADKEENTPAEDGEGAIDSVGLRRLGESLVRWFRDAHEREITVVLGGLLDGKVPFDERFSEMEEVLETKFFYDEGVVLPTVKPASETENGNEMYDIEKALSVLSEHIHRGRYDLAKPRLAGLIDEMQNSDRYPVMYIKYVCVEIVKTLFDASSRKEPNRFKQHLDLIYKTAKLSDLKAIMLSVVEGSEPEEGAGASDSARKAIEDVVHMIESEYGTDLSLDSLAERVYLSPSYLSHLFSRHKGISINKYMTQYRMERARQLLLTTNRKIVQISRDVGYANVPYFSSLFKAHYGRTPTQYREGAGT
ncbi:response regulator [Paenibacillus sp. FSL W7-1279]|uniref:response regulator transcription factor n=1 Tax=Paenibacillus sp. FSL W7-1279 TaxID=2921697 RepID=UPI0030D9D51A